MLEVGATARVRDLGGIDQRRQLAFLGIDHGHLVGRVGSDEEVALARIPAAVVQELGRVDRHFLQVGEIRVVTSLIMPVSLMLITHSGLLSEATIDATRGSGW
jgi:hypothetical protein